MTPPKIVIGVVTYNRLDIIKKCWESWRVKGLDCYICDNSEPDSETRNWILDLVSTNDVHPPFLLFGPENSLSKSRNLLINIAREADSDFILLVDSDVEIHLGSVHKMAEAMNDPRVGKVGFEQAHYGKFNVSPEGYVEELANECLLTRVSMWQEIGLYPECQDYYSADSWKSTIANMHGWRTKMLPGTGYTHYAHSSQELPGVKERMAADIARWKVKDVGMEDYWRARVAHGKGVITNWEGFTLPREQNKM